jgi:hypothetical protein
MSRRSSLRWSVPHARHAGAGKSRPRLADRAWRADVILATAVLAGLVLNAALVVGRPSAAYVLVFYAVREVREIFFADH